MSSLIATTPKETRTLGKERREGKIPILWYILMVLTVVLTALAPIPELISAARGKWGGDEFGFARGVREAVYLLMAVYVVFYIGRAGRRIATAYYTAIAIIIFYVSILIIINDGNITGGIVAIRMVFLANLWVFFYLGAIKNRIAAIKFAGDMAKYFILFNVPVAIYQVLYFPPVKGATFLGSRAFGLSPNPILFSQIIAALALYICIIKDRNRILWSLICACLILTTGGRSGIVTLSVILVSVVFIGETASKGKLILATCLGIAALLVVYYLSSLSYFSGRSTESGISGEVRWTTWSKIVMNYIFTDVGSILFGIIPGYGSNALYNVASKGGVDGLRAVIADNMFMSIQLSYGLVGVSFFLVLAIAFFKKNYSYEAFLILLCILILGSTQNIPEIHIVNLYIGCCIGAIISAREGALTGDLSQQRSPRATRVRPMRGRISEARTVHEDQMIRAFSDNAGSYPQEAK